MLQFAVSQDSSCGRLCYLLFWFRCAFLLCLCRRTVLLEMESARRVTASSLSWLVMIPLVEWEPAVFYITGVVLPQQRQQQSWLRIIQIFSLFGWSTVFVEPKLWCARLRLWCFFTENSGKGAFIPISLGGHIQENINTHCDWREKRQTFDFIFTDEMTFLKSSVTKNWKRWKRLSMQNNRRKNLLQWKINFIGTYNIRCSVQTSKTKSIDTLGKLSYNTNILLTNKHFGHFNQIPIAK